MIKPGMFISDRYEIIDKVGSGGMADVYKAKCHRLNRYVAIKILKPEYSNDKNFVTKFRGEAQSAAGLSHPNIVNVYDVGEDDGLYYIVMELVEGITLKKFIERKGKLEIKEAVGISIQIAQGMEAAHSNHIIHRDIKPQNIIISRDGKVKVTDFGIAKAASSNTVTQNAIGSVHYLSPEQARGGYSDEKSDIYSLGVTLYEMLTGKVPFAGDNTVSVALLHIQGEAVPVRELDQNIPVSVDKIVQKCMQKKPERRYLNASELIADLKKSILQPDGDYVKLNTGVVSDSPTIHMTDDEMNHIKSAAKSPAKLYDASSKDIAASKVQKEEEEELDSVDSRVEKVLIIGTIVAAITLGLVIIYFVGKFFGFFDFGSKPKNEVTPIPTVTVTAAPTPTTEAEVDELKTVPKVIGAKKEDAEKTLKAVSDKFNIAYAEDEYSEEFEKGYVIDQYPKDSTEVLADSEITLTLSAGPELIEMPDVYNLTVEQAKAKLGEDFKIDIVNESNDDISKGMIIRTSPARSESANSKTMVNKGSTVTLYVSSGPDTTMATVPSLLGKTEDQAATALAAVGLELGSTSYASSSTYAEDLISFQSTTKGLKVPVGSKIDITVSTGPEATATPTPTPEPEETGEDDTPTSGEATMYRYVKKLKITNNPFKQGESGVISLDVEQNGYFTEFFRKTLSYEDFVNGYTVEVEGFEEGEAFVYMNLNDVPVENLSWSVDLVAELVE